MKINYHLERFKRRYPKKARIRIVCCVLALFVTTVVSIRSVGGAIMNTIGTKKRFNDKNNELIQAREKNKLLTRDLMKLDDPEFIAQYIRDDQLVLAEGEVFFVLPEEEVEDDTTKNSQ